MADVISLLLTAKNDASKAINQVEKDIQKLNKSATSVSNVDKALSAVGTGLAIGAFAATASMIAEGASELSQAGASVDRLRVSFENLAAQQGTSGAQILSSIDSVTQGTLSQQQMMEQANAAMLLGVANTGDEFATLAKIAVDRGRAMGISMEYAFESIVKGVGRMSPLILDNLGIVIDADTTYAKYAETIGKTADALTDIEKKQALLSRLKVEVADFDLATVNDAASAWEKLSAAQANAVAAAGSWLNTNTGTVALIDQMVIALDKFSGKLSNDDLVKLRALNAELTRLQEHDMRPGIAGFLESLKQTGGDSGFFGLPTLNKLLRDLNEGDIEKINSELQALQNTMNEDWKTANMGKILPDPEKAAALAAELAAAAQEIKDIDEYVERVSKQLGGGKEEAKALVAETIKTSGGFEAAIPALNDLIDGLRRAKEEAAAMVSAINGAQSGFMGAVMGAFDASGFDQSIIEAAKSTQVAFDQALVAIEDAGYSLYDTEAAVMIVEREASSAFLSITESINEAEKATGGATAATKTLTKEYQGLQGIVEGLLSAATGDIGGLDLDTILPREDAINENARRLAAIANEGIIDQPWLEEFKQEAPGIWGSLMLQAAMGTDVKTAAAEILRNFQNGLRPELVDRGKLKEIAKRMFTVDQETKKMVDEIATELANEMGISIEEAKKAVGSAAGVKRELTDEEKQAIVDEKLAGLKAFVGFNFGERTDAIQPAIDKGILDKDGNMVFNAKINFGAGSFPAIGSVTETPEGEEAKPQEFSVSPVFATDTLPDEVAKVTEAIGAMEPIIIPIKFDDQGAVDAAKNTFAVWANGFLNTENMATFGIMFSTTFANELVNQSGAINMIGYQTGVYIYNGFLTHNTGASIAGELANQLTAAQAAIEGSANTTGRLWGEAFLSIVRGNVPMDLITILTDLITPEVLAEIRAQKGLEGAS